MQLQEVSPTKKQSIIQQITITTITGTVSITAAPAYRYFQVTSPPLSNNVTVVIELWVCSQDTTIAVGSRNISIRANTVKQSITIRNWPFRSTTNFLQVIITPQLNAPVARKLLDTSTVIPLLFYDLVNGARVVATYFLLGTLDGTDVQYSWIQTSTSDVAIVVPYFRNSALVDPTFEILLGSEHNAQDGSSSTLVGGIIGGIFAFLVISSIVAWLLVNSQCPHRLPEWLRCGKARSVYWKSKGMGTERSYKRVQEGNICKRRRVQVKITSFGIAKYDHDA